MNKRRDSLPKTALERLEQGKLTDDDLRVMAHLLQRPDLAQDAKTLQKAAEWANEAMRQVIEP